MPLEVGAKLGPYEITGKLGAGGMGEVWKARDTRLNRTVAIKTSHEAFNARFEREARAVAALNHPNICQLYDVGPDYLVLEYVEGTEIAATDNVRKLLDLAIQIADGMAAAHAAGFIHRDLKPSNVLVTRDGRVKILDFGLAKNVEAVAGGAAPTITGSGLVAGTAAYMSPEQIRGSAELDARSDQFAFGLILYEIATGKRAFERASGVETLMAICRDDAEPLPATLPAPVRWTIERCLAKEPAQRYESSRDLYLELRSVRDHLADASTTQQSLAALATAPRRSGWRLVAALGGVAVLALIAGALLESRSRSTVSTLRFIPLSFEPGGQYAAVWSPDSHAVAFSARESAAQPPQLYVRYLDSPVATQITRFRGARFAYPDAWTSTGRILFSSNGPPGGLWSISPVGGEAELVTPVIPGGVGGPLDITRDGATLAILRRGDDGLIGPWLVSLRDGSMKRYEPAPFAAPLVRGGIGLRFSPDGRRALLMWASSNGPQAWLMNYPPDGAMPRRVLPDLPLTDGTPTFSWLGDSRHVVVSVGEGDVTPLQLYVADTRTGALRILSGGTTNQVRPVVSPDGKKLVFTENNYHQDIVSLNVSTAAVTPLIATERGEWHPAWGRDEPALVYVTNRNGADEIWLRQPGQADKPLVTPRDFSPETTLEFIGPELSPDGRRVIYLRFEPEKPARLWISAVAGGQPPVSLIDGPPTGVSPGAWSPDGANYVYVNAREGKFELMKVRTTGQATPETLVTDVDIGVAQWSPAGDWIAYSSSGLKLISPDGTKTRDLGFRGLCTFARDVELLYCLKVPEPDGSRSLVTIDYDGHNERVVGTVPPEYAVIREGGRLSLSPDGKSVAYSVLRESSNLWLIDGLDGVALP
jgi:eukaryotic-like serine/threonine-protein kinase